MVIVANTTFRAAPWADYLFAMDDKWWMVHRDEVEATFKGKNYCFNGHSGRKIATALHKTPGYFTYGNTGAGCISLAAHLGATRIILLGYDAQRTGGKNHHHGNHPKPLGNCGSILNWPKHFRRLADALKHIEIINCSRQTVLKHFPRMALEDALGIVECDLAA